MIIIFCLVNVPVTIFNYIVENQGGLSKTELPLITASKLKHKIINISVTIVCTAYDGVMSRTEAHVTNCIPLDFKEEFLGLTFASKN